MSDIDLAATPEPIAAEQDKLHQERLDRCRPVAKKLLTILAKHQEGDVVMGENDAVKTSVTPVAEEIIAMMLAEDIHWSDRQFIFQLAMQPVATLGEVLENAFSISWERAMQNKWGKDAVDLKISDVHNALGGEQV